MNLDLKLQHKPDFSVNARGVSRKRILLVTRRRSPMGPEDRNQRWPPTFMRLCGSCGSGERSFLSHPRMIAFVPAAIGHQSRAGLTMDAQLPSRAAPRETPPTRHAAA